MTKGSLSSLVTSGNPGEEIEKIRGKVHLLDATECDDMLLERREDSFHHERMGKRGHSTAAIR